MNNEIDESLLSDEPLSDQVFHQFLALLRHKRQYARQIETEQGIKPRDFSVLRFLLDSGPATVSQVQAFLHNSPSTASTLIAQLEEAGYVSRRRSDEDNRVVIVSLEPAGQTIAEQAPFGGLPLLRRRLARLPEERLVQIQDVLVELMALMEAS
ncbi:MAG: winged helix-turn-helix transcriptional regulator [Ardenticatenaceae bacterium]|nr:winged helix-turn-helix transcriptional regulator [Ardenticatenaceae bacterium]MCB9445058.1 winged helix-turn-helix transcriptional regulator [Ardenticatenaceae bacterium]